MKIFRYTIFIPIIFVIIATVYTLLPMALFGLISLSKLWLVIFLIFFGALVVTIYQILPGGIAWLTAKISPNKNFAYYTILIISILLGIVQIYGYWTIPDITADGFGKLLSIILTFITIGFASSFSFGAGIEIFEKKSSSLGMILTIGTFTFYTGIFLAFCLLTTKICCINPDKTYTWYSGIWHGMFVIPNWIVSWFVDDIYCKAPKSTTAYRIWWWISFIFIGLSILGGNKRHKERD